ncbi:VanZ family protein [Oscillibacter sp.]|uniref:VanZ family protein n=1 Tax=Oscillibacter sp. TaxID=1945593 RepID=UPI001B4C0DC5|nr:VanZ family protein [Oscillibacter sp.]MBP3510054.1 VanZ family protein [Oscillibacter sp.]
MKRILKFLLWLPALLWYRVIWSFSAQTAAVSGDLSDRLLWRLMALVSPAFAGADAGTQNAAVELLSFFERKAAHMFLYFVLILLLWLALLPLVRGKKQQVYLAVVLCAALAGLDEYHQTFIPGRSGEMRDVCVDLAGAAIAVLLVAVLLWAARWRREGRRSPAAWLPLGSCALLVVAIAAVPMSFSELPPFVWALEQFVPDFPMLDSAAQTALLAALSPILLEVLFLAACGLLGAGGVLSAALAIRKPLPAIGVALGLSAVVSALPALLWHLPLLSAVSLTVTGWTIGIVLWLLSELPYYYP